MKKLLIAAAGALVIASAPAISSAAPAAQPNDAAVCVGAVASTSASNGGAWEHGGLVAYLLLVLGDVIGWGEQISAAAQTDCA
jgi:hypothetical protein